MAKNIYNKEAGYGKVQGFPMIEKNHHWGKDQIRKFGNHFAISLSCAIQDWIIRQDNGKVVEKWLTRNVINKTKNFLYLVTTFPDLVIK